MLAFDEASHSYTWHGKPVPGVTSILAPVSGYGRVPRHLLEAAANFGKAVHMACELDDLGELDEDCLDHSIAPCLAAWRDFSRDHAVQWEKIEQPGYSQKFGYAGTADRIGFVKGVRAVLDIKTTAKLMPTVGPQLSAYAQIEGDPTLARFGLQLRKDGTYHLEQYTNPMDWPVFASLLTVRNWCEQHDLEPEF